LYGSYSRRVKVRQSAPLEEFWLVFWTTDGEGQCDVYNSLNLALDDHPEFAAVEADSQGGRVAQGRELTFLGVQPSPMYLRRRYLPPLAQAKETRSEIWLAIDLGSGLCQVFSSEKEMLSRFPEAQNITLNRYGERELGGGVMLLCRGVEGS
jgi:hypothetical protein